MNMQKKSKIELFCAAHDFSEKTRKQFNQHGIEVTSVFGFIFVPSDQFKKATSIYNGKVEA